VKKDVMGGECSMCGGRRGACKVLVVKPEGERPFLRHGHRWEDNIKVCLHEVGWGGTWTGLIWLGMRTGGRLM